MSTIEQVIPRPDEATDSDEPVVEDTALRCGLALAIMQLGMAIAELGVRRLSRTHNARTAYLSAWHTWRDRVSKMPWWGMVPTSRRWISPTQAAWIVVALLVLNAAVYAIGMPFVPMDGLLRHNVPQLTVTVGYRGPH